MTNPKLPPLIVSASYAFWKFVTIVVATLKYRLRAQGTENIPRSGPVILAANHVSWLDPPVVGAYCPRRIQYMAKKELFEIPWLGFLITTMGAFPVDREGSARAAIKQSMEILKSGGCLGIFPEGGRNVAGDKQAQTGVALISALSGTPVVPVAVINTERQKERPRPQAMVVYGKAISPPAGKASREDLAAYTEEIMAAIAALREQA